VPRRRREVLADLDEDDLVFRVNFDPVGNVIISYPA
jgi:hypothetical protein